VENLRTVRKTVTGKKAVDGAGVHLVRVIGHNDTKDFDPFLMLDAFDSENPDDYTAGFPWHPHRGIETITYLIQGNIEHGDSLGNKGTIRDGDCQWMTAGSGIIHQEMPKASKARAMSYQGKVVFFMLFLAGYSKKPISITSPKNKGRMKVMGLKVLYN